jgi:hypothetical protein
MCALFELISKMTKQIVYPNFVTRILATTIDLFCIKTVSTPITQFFSTKLFLWNFRDYVVRYGINLDNQIAMSIAVQRPEFAEYATFGKFGTYLCSVLFIQIALLSGYFIYFWHKAGWTPGKYILGLRIRDAEMLENPTIYQCIKRVIWYAFALISIWFIGFTEKRQGLHDKVAGTIVIKR